jgi:hypothetical protein
VVGKFSSFELYSWGGEGGMGCRDKYVAF